MLKTRVRLPALTYGINKLISLANIRKYRNIMYRYFHDEAEKATPALRIRKVSTSERASQIISLPRRGHEHKPNIHRRQTQTIQRTDVLSHKTVHKTTGEDMKSPTIVIRFLRMYESGKKNKFKQFSLGTSSKKIIGLLCTFSAL